MLREIRTDSTFAGDPDAAPAEKLRIRFEKAGELRLVSHHDLMHCFERMLRRAELPFRTTQGFHPKPKMVFALSLALGVIGRREVVEIELQQALPVMEVHRALCAQCPLGLRLLTTCGIDRKTKAQPMRIAYRLALPESRVAAARVRTQELLQASECWVERRQPKPRRLDVRPYICDLCLEKNLLEMCFWVSPKGTARPAEVLASLGLDDLLYGGLVLERTNLELRDEMTELENDPAGLEVKAAVLPNATSVTAKPARSEPLMPGPMSFDS